MVYVVIGLLWGALWIYGLITNQINFGRFLVIAGIVGLIILVLYLAYKKTDEYDLR